MNLQHWSDPFLSISPSLRLSRGRVGADKSDPRHPQCIVSPCRTRLIILILLCPFWTKWTNAPDWRLRVNANQPVRIKINIHKLDLKTNILQRNHTIPWHSPLVLYLIRFPLISLFSFTSSSLLQEGVRNYFWKPFSRLSPFCHFKTDPVNYFNFI